MPASMPAISTIFYWVGWSSHTSGIFYIKYIVLYKKYKHRYTSIDIHHLYYSILTIRASANMHTSKIMQQQGSRSKPSIFTQIKHELFFLFVYYVSVIWRFIFGVKVRQVVKSQVDIYVEDKKEKFLNVWSKLEDVNANIEAILYDNEKLEKELSDKNNTLEQKWKSRILYETTPNGNIVMHYNILKQSFDYYADNKSMTYQILNAVAMKYCYIYRCRHLFIDEYILDTPSPLVAMNKVQPVRKGNGGNEPPEYGVGTGQKILKPMSTTVKRKIDRMEKEQKETNRFIHCGKCGDFTPFKLVKKQPANVVEKFNITFKDFANNNTEKNTSSFPHKQENASNGATSSIENIPTEEETDNAQNEETKEKNRLKMLLSKFADSDFDDDSYSDIDMENIENDTA